MLNESIERATTDNKSWHSVKCIFQHDGLADAENMTVYEERIVLVRARDLDEAIQLGEVEAEEYAASREGVAYIGFISAYRMSGPELKEGTEVYSVMRQSSLTGNDFLDRYYDDGSER